MNFRKASINGVSYGKGITEIGKAAWKLQGRPIPQEMLDAEELALKNAVPHVSFYCPDFGKDYNDSQIFDSITNLRISVDSTQSNSVQKNTNSTNQKEKIRDFYRYLSVCHEIIPERLENGDIKLSAPNPDDEALVCAAGFFGFQFQDRRERFAIIHDKELDRKFEIEVLYTIPFSSSRKRMSVIVRDIDKKIKIITKGADSMMFSRCDKSLETINSHTQQHVDQYSIEGLRCLVVAVSVIEEENFDSWSKHYDEANTDLNELEKKKKGESNDIETLEDLIERNLQVIGATAIEDRLQDGVPDCIERLSQSGIKVWVLTGDKEETAINIAVACNLLAPPEFMDQIIINSTTAPDAKKAAKILKREVTVSPILHSPPPFTNRLAFHCTCYLQTS
jgi:magnesium-transporting ATPase (P-type)